MEEVKKLRTLAKGKAQNALSLARQGQKKLANYFARAAIETDMKADVLERQLSARSLAD